MPNFVTVQLIVKFLILVAISQSAHDIELSHSDEKVLAAGCIVGRGSPEWPERRLNVRSIVYVSVIVR